jgi:hypothetical protein
MQHIAVFELYDFFKVEFDRKRGQFGEFLGDGRDRWRDPDVHGLEFIKAASNVGSVSGMTKRHTACVNKPEKVSILKQVSKGFTLRQTLLIKARFRNGGGSLVADHETKANMSDITPQTAIVCNRYPEEHEDEEPVEEPEGTNGILDEVGRGRRVGFAVRKSLLCIH